MYKNDYGRRKKGPAPRAEAVNSARTKRGMLEAGLDIGGQEPVAEVEDGAGGRRHECQQHGDEHRRAPTGSQLPA